MPKLLLMFAVSACVAQTAFAENWPEWRGPNGNSVVTDGDYPVSWSEDENIMWKVALPGWGTSTPAIWEDRIFASCAGDEQNFVVCLNREGQEQWRTVCGESILSRNRKASGANPSPVTDGSLVFAYFKSGDLACLDFTGKTVWAVNLQDKYGADRLNWDLGTSPVLTEKAVVVAVMHQGPSYLVAFDKQSGEVLWKTDRDLGAPAEARDSYSTPMVLQDDGRQTLLVLGADHVTAYAAETGRELWRVGGLNPTLQRNFRSIASPTVIDGMVLAPYARGATLTAIRRGGEGDVTETHVAWISEEGSADVPTPVAKDGKVYVCGDRGDVYCYDVQSGELIWAERLPRNRYPYSSSPVLVGDKLYCTREDGTTFVLKVDGERPELIATNALRENTYATPAFVDGQVFLRTSDWLFCIGKKGNADS